MTQDWQRGLLALGMSLCVLMGMPGSAGAQVVSRLDFTRPEEVAGWKPTHDIRQITATPEGMRIEIGGTDPYASGTVARDFPANQNLWMKVRLKSEQGGMGQVFYFTAQKGTNETDSARFPVRAGVWEEIQVPLPPLNPGTYFRFDPPGDSGACILASLTFEARTLLPEPAWPKPIPPKLVAPLYGLANGDLRMVHGEEYGGFKIFVGGQPMAIGLTNPLIGYRKEGQVHWLDVAHIAKVLVSKQSTMLRMRATFQDPDGANWTLQHDFNETLGRSGIAVTTYVIVDQPREVLSLPLFTILPGAGSFGETKGQALFSGLEYLDKQPSEVSRSEADIEGPEARRQVPDTLRITIPLMAIQVNGRYLALSWEKSPDISALFDSPDRLFKGGGHLMGLLFPGSTGLNRREGDLLPYNGVMLNPGKPLSLRATLLGGLGESIVPALQQYVARLDKAEPPPLPAGIPSFTDYLRMAAAGWLDSKIRQDGLFSHAYPGFKPGPAADAALWMLWLAGQTGPQDKPLADRLSTASREAIGRVAPGDYNGSGIGHVRFPVGSLVYGDVAENVRRAAEHARSLLKRFAPDGSIPYVKSPDGLDYGRTHFAPDANGLTAQVVMSVLEQATVCGDKALIAEGLQNLRALDKFANTVPRGAQTWEVPLHTPDILASAYLLRAYTLGYELTGDAHFLEQARYWAWTGVPFINLVSPTPGPVGLYATTPVYGATQWKAPNWMGLPVQWCGLVYADALYRFLPHDPTGPWKRLADGITASGVQQTWPIGKNAARVGLLPDSFALRTQGRNDSAINPATLLACAMRFYDRTILYDRRILRSSGWIVHIPGALADVVEKPGRVSFHAKGWSMGPYYVLIAGLKSGGPPPHVRIDGKGIALNAPQEYHAAEGWLILKVTGQPRIEIESS